MTRPFLMRGSVLICLLASVMWVFAAEPKPPVTTPIGPFGYSQIRTSDDGPVSVHAFQANGFCGICHERELKEVQGSIHAASHIDPLYRRFAELAREEAGKEVYAYCSGCHSPAGVVTEVIPARQESELPESAKAGVSCEACHQISDLTGADGPWGEPGNASFVLRPGTTKYGDSGDVAKNLLHTGEKRDFFSKSEFCASCHTVIHPVNGLRIEHTYEEWKSSVYAEKGIQCQDCHMRSIDDALKVAETLRPVVVEGQRARNGPTREIHPHYFFGGNLDADRMPGREQYAEMVAARLRSVARIVLQAPAQISAGREIQVEVTVHNVAAGHNLPTGVTELRQMWVDLNILDEQDKSLFRFPGLDEQGELRPDAIWYGAVAVDLAGKPTVKPWEMTRLARKRTIPPKQSLRDTVSAMVPADASGQITIEARLFYRSVSPGVVAEIMGEEAYTPKIVEMAQAQIHVTVE